jgi:hypothetical protein
MEAEDRGAGDVLRQFESQLHRSVAVIARSIGEVQRLVTSDNEIYATYYGLIRGEVQIPKGNEWDILRRWADTLLFLGYENHIRFAALSLDGRGLSKWGECFMVLRAEMIAHRASLLEENSVLWMKRHVPNYQVVNLPGGYRATWEDRSKLAVAKLARRLRSETADPTFAAILIEGQERQDADFVEVHIWGPITRRTCERVLLARKHDGDEGDVRVAAINQVLGECGASVDALR